MCPDKARQDQRCVLGTKGNTEGARRKGKHQICSHCEKINSNVWH